MAVITVSPGCARAMAAGRKTMLRQVAFDADAPCPLGAPGDRVPVSAPNEPMLVEIVQTRLERLRAISDDDLEAEGGLWREHAASNPEPRAAFGRWWDSLHARAGTRWDDDPLVWVVTFRTV
jgi:hypothetical protein